MHNPYQSPQSPVLDDRAIYDQLREAARGQKLIIYAILLYFLAAGLRAALGDLALLLAIPCLIMSWIGIYKIGQGLGYPVWLRIFHILCMLIPLVGLLLLVVLSSRTTSRLKKAGYSVGLLGART